MNRNKSELLRMLQKKNSKEITMTYEQISKQFGYSIIQVKRLSKELKEKDIESILVHGNTGKLPAIAALDQEIEYIREFKKQYPVISIAQFQDIYNEDVIFNPQKKFDVQRYGLKQRSESFFQQLFKKEGWKSPIKHKCFKGDKDAHPLRDPSPRRGILIMTDGTPHDWFQNGNPFSLHMTLDDATGEVLSGWFTKNESQLGYCYAFKIMFEKYGIPQSVYGDRTTILWDPKEGNLTQVGRMLDELGIELIYANSAEAKGKIEKMNNTIQNRLLNDIKRFDIKTYEQLNKWFNDYYVGYINYKFSYEPKEEESEFVPLGETNLSNIMCIKAERTILNGNMISIGNAYYVPLNDNGKDFVFYKGTKVEVWKDVFDGTVKIFKNGKIYNTRKAPGHVQDPTKREQKRIQDQKDLERVLKERDERVKKNLEKK